MALWTKICGITRVEDAQLAARCGASALGFVMHIRSMRHCDVTTARAIIRRLPASVVSVGVWFDESASTIAQQATDLGCQCIQNYDIRVAAELGARGFALLPAIVPVHASIRRELNATIESLRRFNVGRIIIDAGRARSGMDRKSQPFESCREVFGAGRPSAQLVLAGGLNPDNVVAAIDELRPDGIDVASGIESAPGRKDPQKLERFMKEVRQWDEKATSARTAGASCLRP